MKESKKKVKVTTKTLADFDKCIEDLAEVIIEDAKEHHYSELEPFESYAAKVRTKIHANMEQFRDRFAKGYKILLEELEKNSPSQKESPPDDKSIKP